MSTLASVAPGFYERTQARIRPAFLKAIGDWRRSDCTDPARFPPPDMAPNWRGPDQPCHLHGDPCRRCHSCSACRPEQREPGGDWDDWLFLAGRGSGKTRSAAELVGEKLATNRRWRIAVLAPTYADARDTCIEGESGLLAVFDRWGWSEGEKRSGHDYTWNRSLGELKVHVTGSQVKLFSAEKPARLRGPQHHFGWVEELAQVVRDAPDAWDMLKFGLRLGKRPQCVATTTPLPVQLIKDLLVDPRCITSRGTTDTNAANLPAVTLRALHRKYDGTRLGRQELDGELLTDIPGALWKRAWIDERRINLTDATPVLVLPEGADGDDVDPEQAARLIHTARVQATLDEAGIRLVRIMVAVDPAVTSGEDADATGLIVVGADRRGRMYVLEDRTLRDTPDVVSEALIDAYDRWEANGVVVEVNNGGEWIPAMVNARLELTGRRPGSVPCVSVRAKKGKRVRAEPVSALYQQGHVRHVGTYPTLEDQLCIWTPEKVESPDRMDALVYAVLHMDSSGHGSEMYAATGSIPRHQGFQRIQMPTTSVRR